MNESNRNTRTLIVSFVVAIMALIPLRFVEVGQVLENQAQVLGESVVLPSSEVVAEPVLEAPYNEIEANKVNCVAKSDSQLLLTEYKTQLESGLVSANAIDQVVEEMVNIEKNTCK